MSADQKAEELYISEPKAESLMVFVGEGSGENLKVGNEEKKKIFFFGQPGCLKHSPLRANPSENHNNHNKAAEGESAGNVKDRTFADNNKSQDDSASDDEDGNDLLDRISKVLEDEPVRSLPLTPEKKAPALTNTSTTSSPASPDHTAATSEETDTVETSDAANRNEITDDSQSKHDQNLETSSETEIASKSEEIVGSENENKVLLETVEAPLDVVQSNANAEGSCCSSTQLKSIVPYDDDSTSSSSRADTEKELDVCASDQKVVETPQLNESASLQTDNDTRDTKLTDDRAEDVTEGSVKDLEEKQLNEAVESNVEITMPSEEAVEAKPPLDDIATTAVTETELSSEENIPDASLDSSPDVEDGVEQQETLIVDLSSVITCVAENVEEKASPVEFATVDPGNFAEKDEQKPPTIEFPAAVSRETEKDEQETPTVVELPTVAAHENDQETRAADISQSIGNNEHSETQIESEANLTDSKPEAEMDDNDRILAHQEENEELMHRQKESMKLDDPIVTEDLNESMEIEENTRLNTRLKTSPDRDLVEPPVAQETRIADEAEVVEDKEVLSDSEDDVSHDDNERTDEKQQESVAEPLVESEKTLAVEAKDGEINCDENVDRTECLLDENLLSESPVEHENIAETPTHDDRDDRDADIEKEENVLEEGETEKVVEQKPEEESCKTESINEDIADEPSRDDDKGDQLLEQEQSSPEDRETPSENTSIDDSKINSSSQMVSDEKVNDQLSPESPPPEVSSEAKSFEVNEVVLVEKPINLAERVEIVPEEEKIFIQSEIQVSKAIEDFKAPHETEPTENVEVQAMIQEQSIIVKEITSEADEKLEVDLLNRNEANVSNREVNCVEPSTAQEDIDAEDESEDMETVSNSKQSLEEPPAVIEQHETAPKPVVEEAENISSPDDFNDYQDDVSVHDSDVSENEEQLKINHEDEHIELDEPSKETMVDSVCAIEDSETMEKVVETREPENLILEVPSPIATPLEDAVRENSSSIDEEPAIVEDSSAVMINSLSEPENIIAVKEDETLPTNQTESFIKSSIEVVDEENKVAEGLQQFAKPSTTRKRKISDRRSISESDSEGNNAIDSVSRENTSEDEEVVLKKKPRMRGKTTTPRKIQPARSAAAKKAVEVVKEKVEETLQSPAPEADETESKQTLQNLQFDYDGTEDIVANVAAIRTLICKEPKKETASDESEEEGSDKRPGIKRSCKTKRGRLSKRNEADSSSDEDSAKQSIKTDSKRSKTFDESKEQSSPKKKRETGAKGMLKYIDTSLVIETTENEAPVRQSRRIAQQKIREETERRQMEEKMLKQMKLESEKKKKSDGTEDEAEAEVEEYHKESSGDDESFKGSRRKKKSKIKPSDKQWQTSSSHSEHSESEDYLEHVPSDPGSPLFKSDHEFSPESDVDDTTQVQPVKRARTAKKLEAVSSSDDDDINPKHACQVCHKTDSPEWILLCDECDCGYHCSCLKPIIFLIPSGNWFCPLCCHKKLVDNLSVQLTQLDTLIYNIETAEIRRQRQKQAEITEQNILQERRKNRAEKERESRKSSPDNKGSNGSSDSDDSSDVPLTDYFYKLRKRNQTAAPSYRFNEYDDLINSAIRHEMDEVKGAGNLGRGKDIATIIDADNEENQEQGAGNVSDAEPPPKAEKKEDEESSGSDIIRPKKIMKRKKKNRKLNNLDVSSEEERGSDEDFKDTSSSDSEVDEEDLSMSSVSESSLDLPSKKSKDRNIRSSTRNRAKRYDQRFINDGDTDSDDEPLIRAKRTKKKDSDEEEFDVNDDEDDEGSLAEEIDSEDLCDDTETDSSSENNWPKRKKKRVASYDQKPRKGPKKNDNEDKAFRAGISKKKVLKTSDKESEGSASETEKGRRKTRGKKLLYLIEDDLDSDESDGIKPGVKRPETPPEEREMFVKKQEEIKRMLAAKDTEAAKKLAAPTIQPINILMDMPMSPSIPFSNEPASLSTIPKNVIESAKALDTDYNRIKPIALGSHGRGNDGGLQSNDMNEEELAKMMEEEDFAQHQLKLAGEAIARSKKLLELEAKEEEFAAFNKVNREKEWPPVPPVESKKRSRKSKSSEKSSEEFPGFSKALPVAPAAPKILSPPSIPPLVSSSLAQQLAKQPMQMSPQPTLMANLIQQQSPYASAPPNLTSDRPSVLSSFMTRPEMHPQHPKIHQPIPPDVYNMKNQPLPSQPFDDSDEKKKGRRKKFTPLRTDLVEGNISKLAKLDPPSVIQSVMNASAERADDKHKVPRQELPKLAVAAPPQIFNPATNPTPSVITRLLQPQQRPVPGPFPQGFTEVGDNPTIRMYPDELKNSSPSKSRGPMQQAPLGVGGALPQSSFGENPFVPRNLHTLYRGPPAYGIPPHARLPPYPFHHLHPNLRPGEYSAPYNIPPQFSYYAPPAHSRQPPQASAISLNHGAPQLVAATEDISNSIRNANNSEEASETSEFGGLVSYFSSQQELD